MVLIISILFFIIPKSIYAENVAEDLNMNGYKINNAGLITGTNFRATSISDSSYFMGKLGLGTTSPMSFFSILDSSGPTNFTYSNGTTIGRMGFRGSGHTSFNIGTKSKNSLVFETNEINRIQLLSSGQIGIGTTTPTQALELGINKNIKLSTDRNTYNSVGSLQLHYTTKEAKAIIEYIDENNIPVVWLQAHNYLTYPTNLHKHFSIETSDKRGLKQTRLGIGYDCDYDCIVQVNQSNLVLSRNNGKTNGNFYINGGTLFHQQAFKFYPNYGSNGVIGLQIGTSTDNAIQFRAMGTDYLQFDDNLILNKGMKLGIGTLSPENIVDISSNTTTIVKVDSTSLNKGACFKLKDSDGVGYTYMTVNDGVPNFSINFCE